MEAGLEQHGPLEVRDDARCLGCGYSLRKLTNARCPECGREFDPARPDTYHSPSWRDEQVGERRRQRLRNRAAEPSGSYRLLVAVALVGSALGVLPLPWPLGTISMAAWITLAGVSLLEISRFQARLALALPRLRKPVLGRFAWKLLAIVFLAVAAPAALGLAFLIHLPLFASDAREIASDSFHAHPPPRFVGVMWMEVDRCPNGIFFISAQDGNPFCSGVTLVRRTSSGSCEHVYGLQIWTDWHVRPGRGRGRPLPVR